MRHRHSFLHHFVAAAVAAVSVATATAHVTYSGRVFGTFTGNESQTVIISNQSFTSSNGWADGTDADFGDAHHGRHFKFTLLTPASVTIKAEAYDDGSGTRRGDFKPAFSVYKGTAHLPPALPDYDTSPVTVAYLNSLGGVHEGALRSLNDWKIGNEEAVEPYDFESMLASLTYIGHAADGTPANFGSAPGIVGDGLLDGVVEKTFVLPAGDYSVFVGGAMYDQADTLVYGAKVSFTVAPDPGSGITVSPARTEGVPYKWLVNLGAESAVELAAHVGAWSWEDNTLFQEANGDLPVGWTHTSAWAGLTLAEDSHLTIAMAQQAGVLWPSAGDPLRTASTASMFPSFTIWKNWDEDGAQDHTYYNRGNVEWAEKLTFVGYVDNSTAAAVSRSFNLPAGKYTIVFGSNAPAQDMNRQGFRVALSTSPMIQTVALKDDGVPGLPGVSIKAFGSPSLNDADEVAFAATLTGTGVTKANDTAILSDTRTAQLKLIAREGDTDPNTGSIFAYLGDPVNDNDSNVLFLGRVKVKLGGVHRFTNTALYRYFAETDTLGIIAREGDVAADVEDGADYKSFSSIVADSGGGAFVAKLNIRGRVTEANDEGVWMFNRNGYIQLLAREGKPFKIAPDDTRVVKSLHILQSIPVVKAAGRSTNGPGGRVLSLVFKDGSSGIFHLAP